MLVRGPLPSLVLPTVVFCADTERENPAEEALRKAEYAVFSNAGNFRRDPLVPLCVPLVNPSHFAIVPHQREALGLEKGYIITNAN